MNNYFKSKIFNWGVGGFLVGLILFFLSPIYEGWLFNSKSNLEYYILNESSIIDMDKDIPDLKILYKDDDIRKQKRTLKIITLKIINTGNAPIRQGDFDTNLEWGFKINNSEIIDKIRVIDYSDAYIKTNLNPNILNKNIVSLNKIILEEERFFILEILVLEDSNKTLKITPVGKIAGISDIYIGPSIEGLEFKDYNFFDLIFIRVKAKTSIIVQAYFLLAVFLFVILFSYFFIRKMREDSIKRMAEYKDRMERVINRGEEVEDE